MRPARPAVAPVAARGVPTARRSGLLETERKAQCQLSLGQSELLLSRMFRSLHILDRRWSVVGVASSPASDAYCPRFLPRVPARQLHVGQTVCVLAAAP